MSADSIEMTTEETTAAPSAPTSFADLTPKMQLAGTVKRLELYGAFIELGPGLNGLIHVSKLGGEQVNRVSDVLKEGDQVSVWVEKVDPERQQVMLTMVPPLAVDWTDLQTDRPYTGKVMRLETFGAFVNIGAEREGLVHISELSHDYVKHPSEVVKVGDEVEVKVLGFNRRKRRIDLSMKALIEKPTMEMAQSQGQGQYQSCLLYTSDKQQHQQHDDEDQRIPLARKGDPRQKDEAADQHGEPGEFQNGIDGK